MNEVVSFDGDGGSVKIERVVGDSAGTDAAIEVLVSFSSRDFAARAPTRVARTDLALFADELAGITSTLTGNAEFVGSDGVVSLRYEIENGSGTLFGVVQWPFEQPSVRTEFEFRTDQTFVGNTVGELASFLEHSSGSCGF